MIRRLLYILTLSLLLVSCKKETEKEVAPTTTPQTTLMYMTGTSLSNYFNMNITAASQAIAKNSLGYGRFLVFKHSDSDNATLTEYKYSNGSCVAEILREYNGITSLSEDAITEVIADTKVLAPADSYNLIISGHATGWVPKDRLSDWDKVSSPFDTSTSTIEDDIDWDAMATSPIVTRYLGGKYDGYFDISELKSSLDAAETHFGYIIFDECYMSSIETLYDLRNNCDYILASPCEIMGAGFPYDTVIPHLFADQGYSSDLESVCKAYYDYYSTYTDPYGCIALTVTAELETLADMTRIINQDLSTEDIDLDEIQAYERLNDHLFFDFEQYMLAKCTNTTMAEYFAEQMERTFPSECRLHTDKFYANIGSSSGTVTISYYSGVTTSAPSSRLTSEWAQTTWAIDTN